MLFDPRELNFVGQNPKCLYELKTWMGLLGRMSSMQTDVDTVREWRMASQIRFEDKTDISYMLDEAYLVISDDISTIVEKEIDLSGVEVWCRLWECASYVSRIIAYPTVRPKGVSPWEYVSSVSALIGIVSNVSAGYPAGNLVSATDRDISRMWSATNVDFICGRGGVWVNFMADMSRVVGAQVQVDATEVMDALAKLRMNAQVVYMSEKSGTDMASTAQRVGSVLLDMAGVYDSWQQRCYDTARTPDFDYDESTVRASFNSFVLEKYAKALVPRYDSARLGGWCRELAFSPVVATSPLCLDLATSVSDAYSKKRMAELTLARLKFI